MEFRKPKNHHFNNRKITSEHFVVMQNESRGIWKGTTQTETIVGERNQIRKVTDAEETKNTL